MSMFTHDPCAQRNANRQVPGADTDQYPDGGEKRGEKTPLASTVADSDVAVSLSLSRMIFFTTADLLAITVTHV